MNILKFEEVILSLQKFYIKKRRSFNSKNAIFINYSRSKFKFFICKRVNFRVYLIINNFIDIILKE